MIGLVNDYAVTTRQNARFDFDRQKWLWSTKMKVIDKNDCDRQKCTTAMIRLEYYGIVFLTGFADGTQNVE